MALKKSKKIQNRSMVSIRFDQKTNEYLDEMTGQYNKRVSARFTKTSLIEMSIWYFYKAFNKKDPAKLYVKYFSSKSNPKPTDRIVNKNLTKIIRKGSSIMPLVKGKAAKTREGISQNIRTEIAAGKKKNQAVAIALHQANQRLKLKKKKK